MRHLVHSTVFSVPHGTPDGQWYEISGYHKRGTTGETNKEYVERLLRDGWTMGTPVAPSRVIPLRRPGERA